MLGGALLNSRIPATRRGDGEQCPCGVAGRSRLADHFNPSENFFASLNVGIEA